ncbi:MAG TPA: nitroreductase family deazaflavin-dependent oxidoreductase [Acidimicrobiia bacterium]|nr:nitroreductase family deazaflavin-dependent oxidoreductase [Acidimicrobiia bacterium]
MGEIGRWVIIGVGSLIAVGLVMWLFLVVTIRTGYGPGLSAIRRLNRRVTNPRVMKTAGGPGASASVIRHVGRISGKSYETPVGVTEAGDDLLITLPYGTTADWLKNVRAVGSAEMVHDGRTFRVGQPEVVPAAEVACHQTRQERLSQRLYGVDFVLRLRRAEFSGH